MKTKKEKPFNIVDQYSINKDKTQIIVHINDTDQNTKIEKWLKSAKYTIQNGSHYFKSFANMNIDKYIAYDIICTIDKDLFSKPLLLNKLKEYCK